MSGRDESSCPSLINVVPSRSSVSRNAAPPSWVGSVAWYRPSSRATRIVERVDSTRAISSERWRDVTCGSHGSVDVYREVGLVDLELGAVGAHALERRRRRVGERVGELANEHP